MLTAYVRYPDGRFETCSSLIDAARAVREGEARVWLDLESPDEWTLMLLGEAFDLHPLAIEDCLHAEQRTRIDPYEGYIFMVLYGPLLGEEAEFVGARELAIFCAAQYLITIHHEALTTLANLRERCRRDPENLLGRGMDHMFYTVVSGLIDGYQSMLDRLEDQATEVEEEALGGRDVSILERISTIKSELLQMRRYLLPLREPIGLMTRGEYAFIGKNIRLYFRDALDHLVRTLDALDFYREQVMHARDTYMSALSQRTNETMKTLTIFASLMLPLTLISGIYGMNFNFLWPPSDHPYGFWIILGAMGLLASLLLYFFRRLRWL